MQARMAETGGRAEVVRPTSQHRDGDRLSPPVPLGAWRESDEELLEHLRCGYPAANALFYDRFEREVNRIVWRLLGADAEHDDLVHDIFCKLLDGARHVRAPGALRGWVASVTVNAVRSELRKRRVRRFFVEPAGETDGAEASPQDHEGRAALRGVFRVLDRLPVRERLAFALRYIDQRPLDEVAALCGCSLATIKRRLRKADQRFRHLAVDDPALTERVRRAEGDGTP
jgi:RNA polymerase sigma-70 factor (ECF subfamily)